MARGEWVKRIHNASSMLNDIDLNSLLRPDLSPHSLASGWSEELTSLWKQLPMLATYSQFGSNHDANNLAITLESLQKELSELANSDPKQYINLFPGVSSVLNDKIKTYHQAFSSLFASYLANSEVVKAILGYDPSKVQKDADDATKRIDEIRQAAVKQIMDDADKVIAEVKKEANEIMTNARQVSEEIAVDTAQFEFSNAADRNLKNWRHAAYAAASSVIAFIGVSAFFYFEDPASRSTDQAVLHAAMRVTILAAMGAVAAFSLRIMRAQMHMREQNLHRLHLTKSLPALVNAAYTSDQRDLILGKLVDAVADFGQSGLLTQQDDSVGPSKLTVDYLTRSIHGAK